MLKEIFLNVRLRVEMTFTFTILDCETSLVYSKGNLKKKFSFLKRII